jgi:acetylglutamate kinase
LQTGYQKVALEKIHCRDGGNWRMNPVVVKIGGSTLGEHDTTIHDLVRLQVLGFPVVVVHGGGNTISEWLEKQGITTEFVEGLRVTTPESLNVAVAVLAGLINKQIVAELARQGGRVVGISGADASLLSGETFDERLGLVGSVTQVDTSVLHIFLDHGLIPVVAPVAIENADGHVSDSGLLNLNADTAAAHIAIGLNASKLVFLTDVPGILDGEDNLLEEVGIRRGKELLSSGVVTRGMIPKVEACMNALTNRIESHIVDGRANGALFSLVTESSERPKGTVFMETDE